MEWAGFSDEDLQRLKQGPQSQSIGRGAMGAKRKSQLQQARRPAVSNRNGTPTNISADALLSAPKPQNHQPSVQRVPSDSSTIDTSRANHKVRTRNPAAPNTEDEDLKSKTSSAEKTVASDTSSSNKLPETAEKDLKEVDPDCAIKKEMDNLEKYRLQQKLIEDQNKKKKQLLGEAIVKRQKMAKAEATKLAVIQRELAHLDHMLTVDVSVIRNKIEDASREYLEAQKRYEKAEHEFVEAKIDLHRKSENKEQLTEHLYTVIHQNEVRKGKKLTELMSKLMLETGEEDMAVLSATLNLPSMTALDSLQHLPNTLAHWEEHCIRDQQPVSPKQKEPSVTKESADSTTAPNVAPSIPEATDVHVPATSKEETSPAVNCEKEVTDDTAVTSSSEIKDAEKNTEAAATGSESAN